MHRRTGRQEPARSHTLCRSASRRCSRCRSWGRSCRNLFPPGDAVSTLEPWRCAEPLEDLARLGEEWRGLICSSLSCEPFAVLEQSHADPERNTELAEGAGGALE